VSLRKSLHLEAWGPLHFPKVRTIYGKSGPEWQGHVRGEEPMYSVM